MLPSKGKALPLHVTQAQTGGSYIVLSILHSAPHHGHFTPGKRTGTHPNRRHPVVQSVETLCYKPEDKGSIPDGVIGIFH